VTRGQPSDASALKLRREGKSFAGIAKTLGYERASYANDAFNRALRELPSDEQVVVRDEENVRLDALESRLRARTDLDVEDVERRLRTIGRLRQGLMAK
jgi:AraC-like DNA-binding protein